MSVSSKKTVTSGFTLNSFLYNLLLLAAGIILFTLPQPNLLTVNGISFLVYFSLIPVFLLTRRLSWKSIWIYGFLYGFGCYCLYTYWLASFHPMGITVIAAMYGFYLMLAFPCFKAAYVLYPRYGWLIQWVVWCAYEYIKTLGFSGFHYGVTGYSQWHNPLLLQCADIAGVWGISALITFPSAWLAEIVQTLVDRKKIAISQETSVSNDTVLSAVLKTAKKHLVSLCVWCVFMVAALVYGICAPQDYSQNKTVKLALIQPNNDPWVGGIEAYSENLDQLINLSNQALKAEPDIQFVVWPETAFVPRIEWHYKYRQERNKFELVEKLLTYFNNAPVPFMTGNDYAVLGYSRAGKYEAVDYNAALLFTPGENCIPPEPKMYTKMHLVPFTEYFPYEKLFPKLYQLLLNGDTHMWEPGTEPVVFTVDELMFGVPICFEDTFGDVCRAFVNNGAKAFVNISNDAWSRSLACQYQHLSMAVFRCVENRVPAARSTASGQTVFVDPNGTVCAMADPFSKTWLTGSMPIVSTEKKTLYTRFGDYAGKIFAVCGIGSLLAGFAAAVYRKKSKR